MNMLNKKKSYTHMTHKLLVSIFPSVTNTYMNQGRHRSVYRDVYYYVQLEHMKLQRADFTKWGPLPSTLLTTAVS